MIPAAGVDLDGTDEALAADFTLVNPVTATVLPPGGRQTSFTLRFTPRGLARRPGASRRG